MNEYKKDGKVKIWARVGMSCWIPEKEYKKLLKRSKDEYIEFNDEDKEVQYILKYGWVDGETYIPEEVFEDIEGEE